MDIFYFGGNKVQDTLRVKQDDHFLYGCKAEKRQGNQDRYWEHTIALQEQFWGKIALIQIFLILSQN